MKLIALLGFFFSAAAYAGDAASVYPVGFSPKGSYYAYYQAGINDGSGFPYAEFNIVSVKQNKVLFSKFEHDDEGDYDTPENFIKDFSKNPEILSAFKKYAIQNSNEGFTVVDRLATDKSAAKKVEFALDGMVEGGSGPTFYHYTLKLKTKEVTPQEEGYCVVNPELLKVTLASEKNGVAAPSIVLLNEKSLSEETKCAYNYNISKVVVYNDSLVVFLSYNTTGFEGPDLRYRTVTLRQNLPIQ